MRKLSSRIDEEKKARRNRTIAGIILVGVMLFSTLGYAFRNNDDENVSNLNINGFEFVRNGNYWNLGINGRELIFRYNPYEVEEVNSNLNEIRNYRDKPLYIYSENLEAESEIYRNLFYNTGFVQRVQNACPGNLNVSLDFEVECEEELPFKTCEDNFILIAEGESESITQEENCVFIRGAQENLTKVTDEFLFKILDIS